MGVTIVLRLEQTQCLQNVNAEFHTFTLKSDHFDRCITDGCGPGFVRIHTRRDTDEILGATIVGDQAGEMISLFTLAMHAKIGAKKVSQVDDASILLLCLRIHCRFVSNWGSSGRFLMHIYFSILLCVVVVICCRYFFVRLFGCGGHKR